MGGIGAGARIRRAVSMGVVVAGILALAAVLGVAGCADRNAESVTTTYAAATETTAAAALSPGQDSPPVADGEVAWDEGNGDTSGRRLAGHRQSDRAGGDRGPEGHQRRADGDRGRERQV